MFLFIWKYFLISLVITSWPIGCVGVFWLIPTYLWIFKISFCYQFLILLHCLWKIYFVLFQSFQTFWGLFYGLTWRMFHVHLRRIYCALFHHFTFSLFMSLYVKCIFCIQDIIGLALFPVSQELTSSDLRTLFGYILIVFIFLVVSGRVYFFPPYSILSVSLNFYFSEMISIWLRNDLHKTLPELTLRLWEPEVYTIVTYFRKWVSIVSIIF